jgi:hypothetical protein
MPPSKQFTTVKHEILQEAKSRKDTCTITIVKMVNFAQSEFWENSFDHFLCRLELTYSVQ